MKPIAIFLAEKLEDLVGAEHWLLVNNAADELRRLQAKVDKLEEAQQEPVAAQCKFDGETLWAGCSIEHYNLVKSEPEKWPQYQVRLLYTSPPAAQQQEPVSWDRFMSVEKELQDMTAEFMQVAKELAEIKAQTSKPWVGLTDVERAEVQYEAHKKKLTPLEFMELHEANLREKNAQPSQSRSDVKPLTDEEIEEIAARTLFPVNFARAIEARLKELNT